VPQFSYTGLQAGKKINGAIVANDRIDAGKKLKNQKIIPTSLNQVKNDDSDADPEIKTFLGMQISSDKLSSVDIMLFTKN
jgi:type II secretory pathway component PulF